MIEKNHSFLSVSIFYCILCKSIVANNGEYAIIQLSNAKYMIDL